MISTTGIKTIKAKLSQKIHIFKRWSILGDIDYIACASNPLCFNAGKNFGMGLRIGGRLMRASTGVFST